MEIILYILGAIGFTHIMVDSKLMQPVREWFQEPYWPAFGTLLRTFFSPSVWIKTIGQIIGCYQCCGFWCGMFVGWATLPSVNFWQILSAGFAGSFVSNFAAIYMNYVEARTIVHLDDSHEDKGPNG